ncbi:MAG: hypothetical protein M3O30_05690 [Planctomycetota bacterium]|nr:hypothetical protein [Planctomycetota bacterium]
MDSLNYHATPTIPKVGSGRIAFWSIFAAVVIPGLIISNIIDDLFEKAYLGHHASGEITPLLVLGVPVTGLVALVMRIIRGKDRIGWGFAVFLGLFGPILALIVIILAF